MEAVLMILMFAATPGEGKENGSHAETRRHGEEMSGAQKYPVFSR
jgi:hypothetical protein